MTEEKLKRVSQLEDPQFFIETFLFIENKKLQTVPFLFNLPQQTYYRNRTLFDLILKARKEGFSSLIEAIWLHACMFFKNEKAVTMAQNSDEMKVHRDRIDRYLQTMGTPDEKFEITLDDDNAKEIYFPKTNSRYWVGSAGAGTFGRSRDITRFHGTEVAHYPDQTVLTAVLNACVDTAPRVLETTANGVGEKFHELWELAGDPAAHSPWKRHFFSCFDDPSNCIEPPYQFRLSLDEEKMQTDHKLTMGQVAWYRRTLAQQTDKSLMAQEHPRTAEEAFIASGRHCFNIAKLSQWLKRCAAPMWIGELEDNQRKIEFIDNPEGNLRVWKKYRDDKRYMISADVAEGLADGAYSVAAVFDRASWEMVAEWRGHIDPGRFGDVLAVLGEFYNWAILCPEMNNHGFTTLEVLKREGYPHILKTTDLWEDVTEKYGFPTDDRTKEKCISALRNAIEEESYYENSPVAVKEMMRAVRDESGKMVSQGGWLDCVMTRCIGLYALKFLTLDESYRDSRERESALVATGRTPKRQRNPMRRAA